MGLDHDANISGLHLVLGLALTSTTQKLETFTTPSPPPNKVDDDHHFSLVRATSPKKPYNSHQDVEEPSLTLGLYCEEPLDLSTQTSSPLISAVSSFSTSGRVVMKRERELSSEETEIERVSSRVVSDEDEDGTNASRKKLRLNKEQSALLEESFKQHSTLNPKQKQALAKQLNLRPRQVEVWFQNRRARTKLKQTEVDCEFLKKCCETLTDENRRLHKELQELKAMKLAQQPLYMSMPAATLTMCPSCERLGHGVVSGGGPPNKTTPFSISMSPYNPFTNSSAAC